jgi:cyclopropane-fatty-acyl-phospholipid synthase
MDHSMEIARDVLDLLFPPSATAGVSFQLWDGSAWREEGRKKATIVLKHPGALRRMFLPGTEVGLAEAYLYDDFDVRGDMESVVALQDQLIDHQPGFLQKVKLASQLRKLPDQKRARPDGRGRAHLAGERHSIERDRQAISYHYDVSNDFYALWLDKRMVYSCAYFHSANDSVDQAQEQKLDYICHKLRLRSGQRFLDVGCGWGGLVIYAAEHYGVRAEGITLSQPQAELANERIRQAGLQSRCSVAIKDYRELKDFESFDALASVGMFEHVGEAKLPEYFRQAYHLLRPGGAFLNHGITRRAIDPPDAPGSFSDAYVFPDGELTPISASLQVAEQTGFELRDVESLREHYAMTLRHWVRRLESSHEEALKHIPEPTYRVWRLFMSGSAHGFSVGRLNVHQSLLVKPDQQGKCGLPLTRADLYERFPVA